MISTAKYGPWAVIPGGSEALGAAVARKLGKAGFNVVHGAVHVGQYYQWTRGGASRSCRSVRPFPLSAAAASRRGNEHCAARSDLWRRRALSLPASEVYRLTDGQRTDQCLSSASEFVIYDSGDKKTG